jgi:ribose-phosphate pyrophosphokinase
MKMSGPTSNAGSCDVLKHCSLVGAERQVKRINVVCRRGLFTGEAIKRLRVQPDIEEIVTTNTVPIPREKRLPNMCILSVAPLLAETINRIHVGKSVSALFDGKM